MMSAGTISALLDFLNRLNKVKIHFRLEKSREDAILVEIAVPGERWEVEFLEDGTVDVERFKSDGDIKGEAELEILFRDYSD